MKRILFIIMAAVLILAPSFISCVGIDRDLVIEEAVTCFCDLCDEATAEINEDINVLNEQIAWIEQKEDALAEITYELNATVNTLDLQVADKKLETGARWEYIMTSDQYGLYSNEYYGLEKFELIWLADMDEGIWERRSSVVIMDRETSAKGTPELLDTMVTSRKTQLTNERTVTLDNKECIDRMLLDVVAQKDGWKIRKVDNQIYSISGYGLGYTEQLIDGEWYYYQAGGVVEPMSSASSRLMDVLTTGQAG